MKLIPFISLVSILSASSFVFSCASTEDTFDGDSSSGSSSGNNSTNGGSGNNIPGGPKGGDSGINVNTGGVPTISSEDTCGATEVAAALTPVYMVFVYDKSASMGSNTVGGTTVDNTALRWDPVKNGMIDFFKNAGTTNVQASIAFFAYDGSKETTCAHDYSVPDVAMTPLETPNPLITALNTTVPQGGTPTLPAVIGGIKYAKKLLTDHPRAQAIVVLVTDGEPAIYNADTQKTEIDCAPEGITLTNTIPDIATYVAGANAGTLPIKTHVIGIGDTKSIGALKAIATAGGTEFIQVDPTDATATRTAILTKLTAIQPKTIDCNIELPKAADFDKEKVNVNFVHPNGKVDEFTKSDGLCTKPGWCYDDETAPKYIRLSKTTCDAIQADLEGKLKIILGCPTRVLL